MITGNREVQGGHRSADNYLLRIMLECIAAHKNKPSKPRPRTQQAPNQRRGYHFIQYHHATTTGVITV